MLFFKYTGAANENEVSLNVVTPPLSVDVLICPGCKYFLAPGIHLLVGTPLITSLISNVTPFDPVAGLF